jgi:hypothetical protein
MATVAPLYDVDIHMYDVGTVFLVTITDSGSPIDISSGTSASNTMLFRKPDGTILSKNASFDSNGIDGKIKYVVSGSDVLDQSGTWQLTANVNTSTGKWTATSVGFTVKPQFQP